MNTNGLLGVLKIMSSAETQPNSGIIIMATILALFWCLVVLRWCLANPDKLIKTLMSAQDLFEIN